MKILIADSSKTIRVRLGFLLSDLEDTEIIEVESGHEALEMMTGEDPPHIVLLAWIIKDLRGIEVCKQVRRSFFRDDGLSLQPYIILLTSKSNAQEVAEGLNAGADDYIQKPWDDTVFRARIQVARRTAALQMELKQRIADMESLVQRHELAHNVISKGHLQQVTISSVPIPADGHAARGASLISAHDGILAVEKHLVSAFKKIGCGQVLSTSWDGVHPTRNPHVVWTATLLADIGMWLDFLVQIDGDSLAYLHEAIRGQSKRTPRFMAETLRGIVEIAQNEVRYALSNQQLEAWSVGSPTVITSHSNKIPVTVSENTEHIQLQVGDADIFITVSDLESPVIEASPRQLKRFQIIAEDFFTPWRPDTPTLKRGTSLSESHILRLIEMSEEEETPITLNVMQPSPLGLLAAKVSSLSRNVQR